MCQCGRRNKSYIRKNSKGRSRRGGKKLTDRKFRKNYCRLGEKKNCEKFELLCRRADGYISKDRGEGKCRGRVGS